MISSWRFSIITEVVYIAPSHSTRLSTQERRKLKNYYYYFLFPRYTCSLGNLNTIINIWNGHYSSDYYYYTLPEVNYVRPRSSLDFHLKEIRPPPRIQDHSEMCLIIVIILFFVLHEVTIIHQEIKFVRRQLILTLRAAGYHAVMARR